MEGYLQGVTEDLTPVLGIREGTVERGAAGVAQRSRPDGFLVCLHYIGMGGS